MVRKIFKKRKDNQNKIKPSRRKRKIFATIALALSLLLGKPRSSSSRPSSPNFDNQTFYERVINDRDFNSLDENNRQVILAKAESNPITPPTNRGPSNFPTTPSGGRPSRNVPGVNPYRVAPKIVGQGLGAGANPAGAGNGGGADWDDQSPVPKKEQSQESKTFDYRSKDPKKKKQSAEQCELDENVKNAKIEIVYRIKENPALVREAERMGKDRAAQKDVNNLIEQLSLGNDNPGIGNRRVKGLKNVSEARGRNEGRVYFREKKWKNRNSSKI